MLFLCNLCLDSIIFVFNAFLDLFNIYKKNRKKEKGAMFSVFSLLIPFPVTNLFMSCVFYVPF